MFRDFKSQLRITTIERVGGYIDNPGINLMNDTSKLMKLRILLLVTLIGMIPIQSGFGIENGTAGTDKNIQGVNADRLNVLIITVDDMSCDSIGAFGCELPETTPNIDALAKRGLRYEHAHVQVGNCMPSRNVLFSGLYPHNNRVEGFYQVTDAKHPHLADVMKEAGYFVAIRGKVTHSTPYHPYPAWDTDLTILDGEKQDIKNADSYFASTKRGIEMAKSAGKPFCLNLNISDPHKPFYAMGKKGETIPDKNVPSKTFTPQEVPIPGFLFDDPDVRKELSHYYSSVRRADDCVGAILKALTESGEENNTVIMFLSDHGMPLPFAKTALYHHSTRTPWIVAWPGVTNPGSIDNEHMISAVDLMPTLIEIIGAPALPKQDGRSFLPTIKGESQAGRDAVFKVYNENSGRSRHPMRAIQTKQFLYLFNPWSDGENKFATATRGTMTYRKMQELAPTNDEIRARLDLFDKRIVEEFYDVRNDPDATRNLIDDPNYAEVIQQHRQGLLSMMKASNDHITDTYINRESAEARQAYMKKVSAESAARKKSKAPKKSQSKQNKKLFELVSPKSTSPGDKVTLTIQHKLPMNLGTQKFHVTFKNSSGKRIERKIVEAMGRGNLEVTFDVPSDYSESAIQFSTFVGEEYQQNLLHKTTKPIAVNPK